LPPNALPFSRRERAAQDGFKIPAISRAKRSAGTACSAAAERHVSFDQYMTI
jgi:hypothetical protein